MRRLARAEARIDSLFEIMARAMEARGLPVPPEARAACRLSRRPSGWQRWRQFCWHLHGEMTHYVFYVLIGDAILGRHAPARMRRAAWTNGFNVALGGEPARWLGLMGEHADGNEAGLEVRFLHYGDAWMPGDRRERPADAAVLLGAFEDEDGRWWI